ncbi:hypothetical protein JHK87_052067 [Glycine soja]|nr:hypothetical protein JHK87_052067 [Glycine soja]
MSENVLSEIDNGAIGHVLEPMVTPDDLEQQPQPVTTLFQICQKKGMHIYKTVEEQRPIKYC